MTPEQIRLALANIILTKQETNYETIVLSHPTITLDDVNKVSRFSDEHRAKLSLAAKNRPPISDETRAKKSANHKGGRSSDDSGVRARKLREQEVIKERQAREQEQADKEAQYSKKFDARAWRYVDPE